ncbi:hypothetical protein Poli38472_013484 [Pythium oligandrum]|uniref:HSF-type DNA-binding domain-containing protein n=1 Tax=Pythium oligandrum TaxID=41045 RepID=A0A8K1C836_PYTOL|nr:hypothetical protein Poli38472_013484 [Pythium oligandrum]|eukprot:TMW58010.1 hypothetical protein Poli38472_013484 [Pythium oligandrum]
MTTSLPISSSTALTDATRALKDVAPFLKQLRKMLDEENPDIIRWSSSGGAFEIHDMERMMSYVLPKYFKHRKYTSFQRQLNYFNFRKWTKSKAAVCTFSNEFFVRDQPELAWRITRKKSVHSTVHRSSMISRIRPVKLETTDAYWAKDSSVLINVPANAHPSTLPFPSPTDADAMVKAHDHYFIKTEYPLAVEPHPHTAMPAMDPMESMDWIDVLLPQVDQDDVYPFLYQPSFEPIVSVRVSAYDYGHVRIV